MEDGRKQTIANLLKDIERYNPENLPTLECYVDYQCRENTYDLEANLAVLKLYQLNPHRYNIPIICQILLKALTNLPHTDFVLCKCLLNAKHLSEPNIVTIMELADILERCDFRKFWIAIIAEHNLCTNITGFHDSIRKYVCHVVRITFQTVDKNLLASLLGGVDGSPVRAGRGSPPSERKSRRGVITRRRSWSCESAPHPPATCWSPMSDRPAPEPVASCVAVGLNIEQSESTCAMATPDCRNAARRLQRELVLLAEEPLGFCTAHPMDGNLFLWEGKLLCPSGPYEGYVFLIVLRMPADYPFSPPVVNFESHILHPLVDGDGKVSLEILNDGWNPTSRLSGVLQSLVSMVADLDDSTVRKLREAQESELWNRVGGGGWTSKRVADHRANSRRRRA